MRRGIASLLVVAGTALLGLGAMGLTDDALKGKCCSFEKKLLDFDHIDPGDSAFCLFNSISSLWSLGLVFRRTYALGFVPLLPLWPIARLLVSAGCLMGWRRAKLVATLKGGYWEKTRRTIAEIDQVERDVMRSRVNTMLFCTLISPEVVFLQALPMLAPLLVLAPFVLLLRIWEWVAETVRRMPSPTSMLARVGLTLVALAAALEVDGP